MSERVFILRPLRLHSNGPNESGHPRDVRSDRRIFRRPATRTLARGPVVHRVLASRLAGPRSRSRPRTTHDDPRGPGPSRRGSRLLPAPPVNRASRRTSKGPYRPHRLGRRRSDETAVPKCIVRREPVHCGLASYPARVGSAGCVDGAPTRPAPRGPRVPECVVARSTALSIRTCSARDQWRCRSAVDDARQDRGATLLSPVPKRRDGAINYRIGPSRRKVFPRRRKLVRTGTIEWLIRSVP